MKSILWLQFPESRQPEKEKTKEDSEEDLEFADQCIVELYDHFKEPLSKAGLTGSLSDLLDQWHYLLSYTKHFLDPSRTPYLRVW